MDRLRRMRQADWARLFGIGCVVVGVGLSLRGYPGSDWDALILLMGALILLRGAVEGPSPSRVAGVMRAGRIILFMFAFGAVNRAPGGAEGAVAGALGNWLLWAVAALLLALPLLRRGLARGRLSDALREGGMIIGAGLLLWGIHVWLQPEEAGLRVLVALAVLANAVPILRAGRPVEAGLALMVAVICLVVPPGGAIWPVALMALPLGLLAAVVAGRLAAKLQGR